MNDREHLLDEFLRKYRKLILGNAYDYVHDYYMSEDICQETFLRYFRECETIPREKTKAWLLQVSGNLAKDYLKKGGRYTTDVGLDDVMLDTPDEAYPDPVNIIETLEDNALRKIVLEKLKKRKQIWYDVLLAAELEGKTNEELAKFYGVSPVLISKWKERARRWLQEHYELEEERRERKRKGYYFN